MTRDRATVCWTTESARVVSDVAVRAIVARRRPRLRADPMRASHVQCIARYGIGPAPLRTTPFNDTGYSRSCATDSLLLKAVQGKQRSANALPYPEHSGEARQQCDGVCARGVASCMPP